MLELINSKYELLLQACLSRIKEEMDRLYWNENQATMVSPFLNTGEKYENSTFSVRAYYWGDNETEISLPNFQYKDLEIRWYKHYFRGLNARCGHELTSEFLADMINDCFKSMRRDFGEADK